MNKCSLAVLLLVSIITVGSALAYASPLFAQTLSELVSGTKVINDTSDNALSIVQNTDVGKSRSSSGALHVDNSGNRNTGLTLYTNMGSASEQPLMRMEVDNEDWSEEVLYIHSDSPTSRGLIRLDSPAPEIEFVETDQSGAAGKFEVRVQHDTFQINSRRSDDTTFENKVSVSHGGDITLRDGAFITQGGKPSVFSGGINIVGGCIAVDGECVDFSKSGKPLESKPISEPVQEPAESQSMELSSGEPPEIECNSYTERGSMKLDYEHNRLYICNGPERGWDYTTLSD